MGKPAQGDWNLGYIYIYTQLNYEEVGYLKFEHRPLHKLNYTMSLPTEINSLGCNKYSKSTY